MTKKEKMLKKNKVVLPEKNLRELKGFEEVLDLIGQEGSEFTSPTETKRKGDLEDYEIFNFLEKESSRLSKIDELINKKIATIKRYPQQEILLEKQEEEKNFLKDELTHRLMEVDSQLHHKYAKWFNSVFSPQNK